MTPFRLFSALWRRLTGPKHYHVWINASVPVGRSGWRHSIQCIECKQRKGSI